MKTVMIRTHCASIGGRRARGLVDDRLDDLGDQLLSALGRQRAEQRAEDVSDSLLQRLCGVGRRRCSSGYVLRSNV